MIFYNNITIFQMEKGEYYDSGNLLAMYQAAHDFKTKQ